MHDNLHLLEMPTFIMYKKQDNLFCQGQQQTHQQTITNGSPKRIVSEKKKKKMVQTASVPLTISLLEQTALKQADNMEAVPIGDIYHNIQPIISLKPVKPNPIKKPHIAPLTRTH